MWLFPGQLGGQAVFWWFGFSAPAWCCWRMEDATHTTVIVQPPPGCQNQCNYCRRCCKSFTNQAQAPSPQWSFVNMKAFLSSLQLLALFGGHHMLIPCGIPALVFPKVTLLLRRKHPQGCAPTKPTASMRGCIPLGLENSPVYVKWDRFTPSDLFKQVWIKSIFSIGA